MKFNESNNLKNTIYKVVDQISKSKTSKKSTVVKATSQIDSTINVKIIKPFSE